MIIIIVDVVVLRYSHLLDPKLIMLKGVSRGGAEQRLRLTSSKHSLRLTWRKVCLSEAFRFKQSFFPFFKSLQIVHVLALAAL